MAQTSLIAGFRVHETGVTPREVIPLGKGELILVVDDEAAIRDIARAGSRVLRLSRCNGGGRHGSSGGVRPEQDRNSGNNHQYRTRCPGVPGKAPRGGYTAQDLEQRAVSLAG